MMNIWIEIKQLKGQTLRTLDQRKPFDIVDVTDSTIIVRPHKSQIERSIRRDALENAYTRLATVEKITRVEIRDSFSEFNPAYVAAILAALPGVQHSLRPIHLWISDKP